MYIIYLEDLKTNKRFEHKEYSPYLFKKYIKKISNSKRVKLLSYICY